MSDEPFRFTVKPIVAEANARRLINVLAEFKDGAACSEEIRIAFERATGLRRQAYYDALSYCKYRHWVVGGGQSVPYRLNDDGSWRSVQTPAEEKQDRDRLAHMLDLQTQRNGELQSEVARLRDWASGSNANGVALSNLLEIVSSSTASVRQKLRACSAVLSFKVENADVITFTTGFLESLCANPGTPTDYRVTAAELLRQFESPRVKIPPSYREGDAEPPGPPPTPLSVLLEERRRYCDEMTAKIAAEMGYQPPEPRRNSNSDD